MRKIKRVLLLTFLYMLGAWTCAANAQSLDTVASLPSKPIATDTQDVDADELKSQQQLVAELKFLRKENAELKNERMADKGTIATQARLMEIEKERGDFFKTAAEKGITAGNNCGLITERYDRMEATYKTEVQRLQSENDNLRSSRNWRALFAAGAGAAGGYALCNR